MKTALRLFLHIGDSHARGAHAKYLPRQSILSAALAATVNRCYSNSMRFEWLTWTSGMAVRTRVRV